LLASPRAFGEALADFASSYSVDPLDAGRRLLRTLVDPEVQRSGAQTFTESTPRTAAAGGVLLELFPEAKLVHMVRDGRDVACSLAARGWGPKTRREAVWWWGDRLRRADEGFAAVPQERRLVVHLEALVSARREEEYARLMGFCSLDDEAAVRSFFDTHMQSERAHVGRWRSDLSAQERDETLDAYREVLLELHADGVESAPPLDGLDAHDGGAGRNHSPRRPHAAEDVARPPAGESPLKRSVAGPIFIGGTGRSGTGVLNRLVGSHSAYRNFRELQFHSAGRGGLPSLLSGEMSLDDFVTQMRREWFEGNAGGGRGHGLRGLITREELDEALELFGGQFGDDAFGAAAELVSSVVRHRLRESGKPSWVEASPTNAHAARSLARCFPEATFLHAVRDGRDVAVSIANQPWGPSDYLSALKTWDRRLREAEEVLRALPAERVHRVQLEGLVEPGREERYEELLAFLDLRDEPAMRSYFNEQVTADRARVGRWRSELPEPERRPLDEQYRSVLAKLDRDGLMPGTGLLERVDSDTDVTSKCL